jgi:hypothetical protein
MRRDSVHRFDAGCHGVAIRYVREIGRRVPATRRVLADAFVFAPRGTQSTCIDALQISVQPRSEPVLRSAASRRNVRDGASHQNRFATISASQALSGIVCLVFTCGLVQPRSASHSHAREAYRRSSSGRVVPMACVRAMSGHPTCDRFGSRTVLLYRRHHAGFGSVGSRDPRIDRSRRQADIPNKSYMTWQGERHALPTTCWRRPLQGLVAVVRCA